MANQAIALQARAPQSAGLGPAIAQGAQMINMMAQQRAAERQAAQAQQAMQFAAAEEGRKRDLHPSAMSEASAKAASAELKTGRDFNNFIRAAIASSATPDQVVGFADKIASLPQFQTPMYQDVLSRAVADMPGAFGCARTSSSPTKRQRTRAAEMTSTQLSLPARANAPACARVRVRRSDGGGGEGMVGG
jgi:hypothetical protein